ncbi:amidohydrolase family protein [Paraburkholderia sp. SARCC-3016]|uniref:metal-dependent hydrolase family protein n=1 Tax=Paraburkholderia sp. SARCC-3016 TaxID=3058611 RepID=UPI0028096789|nr:amidohydrolase family protein [Paraburkholderia sp. SARCC-3016]MDQ7982310.1 amidohydrolase family protein [Paraburkholderia sp. SARCC-3016]
MEQRQGRVLEGKLVFGSLDAPLERGCVVTEGERIAWVGSRDALPRQYAGPGWERVDLPGRTIMPGLIDGHTHISFGEARSEEELALYTPVEFRTLKAAWNARKVLQAGVTSAFDAATTYNIAQSVRDAIDSGMFDGPRFAVSGQQLTSHQGLEDSFPNGMEFPPGQAGVLVGSVSDIVKRIRYQVKDGVDAIKVSGSNDSLITPDSLDGAAFTDEEFVVIAKEAHRLGRMCNVHARSRDAIIAAAKAGFDVIYHASYIDDEGIDACLKSGSIICPTLPLLTNILEACDGKQSALMDALQREYEAARTNLPRAYRAGIPFVQGSESGWSPIPYGHWHAREMEIFVKDFGLSTLEAIHAGTLGATRMLRRFGHEVGKLEAGRYADLLVIEGDPTVDITVLQKPSRFDFIFKGGKPVDRTPAQPRRVMHYEKHKIFLNGLYQYDQDTGTGRLLA